MIMGEWKFDDEIAEMPDLSDIKFIDEDGNVYLPDSWEAPPPLTIEFELDDEDKEYLNNTFIEKEVLDLGFLFERMKITNVRREAD